MEVDATLREENERRSFLFFSQDKFIDRNEVVELFSNNLSRDKQKTAIRSKTAVVAAERIHEMNEEFITESELADWLRISKSTLHKLREDGVLPFQLIGSCIRYSKKDIDDWLRHRTFNKEKGQESHVE